MCGDPLSRTRVAADFLRILGFFRCSSSIALHPLKGPVAPAALELPGVSHVKLPLKRRRATGGCIAATLAGVALHCATKPENSQTILVVLVRMFGGISAFQYCTGHFLRLQTPSWETATCSQKLRSYFWC